MELPHHFELDTWLRFVDELPTFPVDRYVTLDARLGWKPFKNLELSIVGQNLIEGYHQEFALETLDISINTEVERSIYGKITWRF